MLLRYLQDLTLQMQIIYILCVHTTSLVWKKKKKFKYVFRGAMKTRRHYNYVY